jgi:toxin ParE1/3/4
MEFQVSLTPQARRDLDRIGHYIALTDTDAAHRFCDELVFAAESLQNFPHRHGNFAKRPNIRKLPYESYLIFYKIDEENRTVEILRFWHSARSQHRLRLREEDAGYLAAASVAP